MLLIQIAVTISARIAPKKIFSKIILLLFLAKKIIFFVFYIFFFESERLVQSIAQSTVTIRAEIVTVDCAIDCANRSDSKKNNEKKFFLLKIVKK